jgi:type IV secretory pathway VirB2 component (pilin)
MSMRTQRYATLYALLRSGFSCALVIGFWLIASHVGAQDGDLSEFSNPVKTVVKFVTNVLGPAVGICGLILAGAMFFQGETGRVFKMALGMIVGGVLIASAETIWTGLFHGNAIGG